MSMKLAAAQLVTLAAVLDDLEKIRHTDVKVIQHCGHDVHLDRDKDGGYWVRGITDKASTKLPDEPSKPVYRSR